ncbi:MAG: Flp pilus assembly complex ATPase component TadA [Armatimonadetes bacterium]|nr:Flp pilus assembly complex ATPase component TadA [Armatimonadota bacterium]
MRAALRQDPDVIMVGGVHNYETGGLAFQAAVEGCLVLASGYGMEACETGNRFIEMGVEPYLVAHGLRGALTLRLARQLCGKCRKAYKPSPETANLLGVGGPLYQADGCEYCRGRGCSGMCAFHEVMTLNDAQREVLLRRGSPQEVRAAATDFVSLREDGLRKVSDGRVALEQFVRVMSD